MDHRNGQYSLPALLVLLVPAAVKLFLQLFFVNGYGLNGDELYYLACSEHLDWGYVDQPPLSILLLAFSRTLFGDSPLSIRFLSALAGSFTVLFTILLARRMGAGYFGQLLASLCALVAPVYLAINHYYSMNAFDILFWVIGLYVVTGVLKEGKTSGWLWFGLVMGIGFENKLSVLFLCFGLVAGLLLTQERKQLFTARFWLGVLIAAVIAAPNIIWQITHGWPTPEWMANARAYKMAGLSLKAYLVEQIILMHPLTVFVWATGLIALLVHPVLKKYRALGWAYLVILAVFVAKGGKAYYLAPYYPLLFAAGAVVFDRALRLHARWLKAVVLAVVALAGLLILPMGLPVLSPANFIAYKNSTGLKVSNGENKAEGEMPDFYAGMFGWPAFVETINAAYLSLPEEDRAKCGIFCQNYSQAGAVDFYGKRFGLPVALSGHNNYWLWGLRGFTGDIMIVIGGNAEGLRQNFEEVTEYTRFKADYVQPSFYNLPIYIVRRPKQPIPALYSKTKNYI